MKIIQHRFVEYIPSVLEEGILYITMEYRTAVHKCICGCGNKVVTPISPNFWKLTYDGRGITLYPSIGNWSFPCQSHYWIRNSQIEYAPSRDNRSKTWKSPEPSHTIDTTPQVDSKLEDKEPVESSKISWFRRIWGAVSKVFRS